MGQYHKFQVVRFGGYCDLWPGVPPQFQPGDILLILGSDSEGMYDAMRIEAGQGDLIRREAVYVRGTVWDEEIAGCVRAESLAPSNVSAELLA